MSRGRYLRSRFLGDGDSFFDVLLFYRYPCRGVFGFVILARPHFDYFVAINYAVFSEVFVFAASSPIVDPPTPQYCIFRFCIPYEEISSVHFVVYRPVILIFAPSHILGYYVVSRFIDLFVFPNSFPISFFLLCIFHILDSEVPPILIFPIYRFSDVFPVLSS